MRAIVVLSREFARNVTARNSAQPRARSHVSSSAAPAAVRKTAAHVRRQQHPRHRQVVRRIAARDVAEVDDCGDATAVNQEIRRMQIAVEPAWRLRPLRYREALVPAREDRRSVDELVELLDAVAHVDVALDERTAPVRVRRRVRGRVDGQGRDEPAEPFGRLHRVVRCELGGRRTPAATAAHSTPTGSPDRAGRAVSAPARAAAVAARARAASVVRARRGLHSSRGAVFAPSARHRGGR